MKLNLSYAPPYLAKAAFLSFLLVNAAYAANNKPSTMKDDAGCCKNPIVYSAGIIVFPKTVPAPSNSLTKANTEIARA